MTSNPVGGTVQRLIELDAERIVLEEAARVVELLGWTDDVQLYLTVATPGMWTDPVATTVGHALSNHHPGEVLLWLTTSTTVPQCPPPPRSKRCGVAGGRPSVRPRPRSGQQLGDVSLETVQPASN